MRTIRQNRGSLKLLVCLLIGSLANPAMLALAGSDRIIPSQKVTLYRGDQVVGAYTKEAPLPEGVVIATEGRCGIKLNDFYLVGEDQSAFSINTTGRQRNLFIDRGTLYFKTSGMQRQIEFITPNGQIGIQRIRLNAAATNASIKGYVAVHGDRSELGVSEGGSMDVLTDKGLVTVEPGKKLILSQADLDIGLPEDEPATTAPEPAPQPSTQTGPAGWSTGTKVALGALGAAAIAGVAIGLGGGSGGGDDTPVSPSNP
jgi:hypothetical protein